MMTCLMNFVMQYVQPWKKQGNSDNWLWTLWWLQSKFLTGSLRKNTTCCPHFSFCIVSWTRTSKTYAILVGRKLFKRTLMILAVIVEWRNRMQGRQLSLSIWSKLVMLLTQCSIGKRIFTACALILRFGLLLNCLIIITTGTYFVNGMSAYSLKCTQPIQRADPN